MSATASLSGRTGGVSPSGVASVAAIGAAVLLVAASVVLGVPPTSAAAVLVVVTVAALARDMYIRWPLVLAGLILVILFIPIRRYELPGDLPFQLEPYRVFVAVLVAAWGASLLVDPRTRLRRTGFEPPMAVILVATVGSLIGNPDRVFQLSSFVEKKLTFFLSFVLVMYIVASVARRFDHVDFLAKALVSGGAVVGLSAMVEARTGMNVFNHLHSVIPLLEPGVLPEAFEKVGAAKLRVFASAEHPIALSAALALITPLAVYLARRYRKKRWTVCAVLLVAGCASAVSRTGILMLVVVALVFLWLRPRETRRLWPLLIPALLVIKIALPGTLGAIKQSFQPPGGLVAEQRAKPGESGSGRVADLGPALEEWKRQPLLGQGFGTRVVDPIPNGPRANILDNQWLGTLLEVGALGFFGWLWFFARVVRRLGRQSKEDDESERGWLLVAIAAGVAAYGVGMFTYDAFSFVQVTFLLFIFVGLGGALLGERPTPVSVPIRTSPQARPLPTR